MAVVTEVLGARDGASGRRHGKRVLDSLPQSVRGGWARSLEDAATIALAWARAGDTVVTLGVGEPWRAARSIVEGLSR